MSTKHDLRKRGTNDDSFDGASMTGRSAKDPISGWLKDANIGATTNAVPGTADMTDRPQATGTVTTGAPSTSGKGAGMPELPKDSTQEENRDENEQLTSDEGTEDMDETEEEDEANDEDNEQDTPTGRYNT